MSTDNKGYVLIHRNIIENIVWQDKPFSRGQAWIDLIMMVNYEDKSFLFDGRAVKVKRGSTITSIRKLAERWGWSRKKVSGFLNLLESEQMISQKRATKATAISLRNYGLYQELRATKRATKEPQKSHRGATEEHKQLNTNESNKRKEIKELSQEEMDKLYPASEGWH